jgi:phenylacetate-CoA ligase
MSVEPGPDPFDPRELEPWDATREARRVALADALQRAAERSPFYARAWDATTLRSVRRLDGGDASRLLSDLPFTGKDDLRRAQEQRPPFGSVLACDPSQIARVHKTSGTTGRPLLVPLTARDADTTADHGGQALWCAGIRPHDVAVHCLNYSMWSGGVTDHLSLERAGATVVPFGVGNTEQLLELPRWLPFTAIQCTPSYVALLLERWRERPDLHERARSSLRLALVGGEPGGADPGLRRTVAEDLEAELVDANYGLAEVLSIFGSECDVRHGLHFHGHDAVWLELIDPTTLGSVPFVTGALGELVLTHLDREAMPLVRYRSRDVVEIVEEGSCSCGRGGFRFLVRGRSDDLVQVRGVNVFPRAVGEVLGEISPNLRWFRIRLRGEGPYDDLPLEVEADPADHGPEVAARIVERIKTVIGCSARVRVVPPGSLPRTAGKRALVERETRDG